MNYLFLNVFMKYKTLNSFLFLFAAIIFFINTTYAQVIYSDESKIIPVGSSVEYLIDEQNTYTFNDILQNKNFKHNSLDVLNLGILPTSSIWIRLKILNKSNTTHLILQLDQPTVDKVIFYHYDTFLKKHVSITMGEFQLFGLRKYLTPDYLFDITIPKGRIHTYYIKINCKENVQIPLYIGTSTSLFNYSVSKNLISGIYIGIMLVMILYNLFIYTSTKDKTYLYYSIFIITTLLTQTHLQGYPFQVLWPNSPWLAMHGSFIFPSLVGIASLEFFKEFLRIKERLKRMYYLSILFIIPYCFAMLLSSLGFYKISYQIIEINAGVISIFMLIASIVIYRMNYREARYFLMGWSIFLLGVCIYILKDFDILPYNNFTRYTMHFGSGIEVILLSFALADKINILKKEKEASQAEVLMALKENEKLITEQNIELEKRVTKRTHELSTTLKNLKDTQAQLVDAEKMASLGQLTAGIAHEINNPINFVSANVKPLQLDIDDLLSIIQKYENINPNENIDEQIKNIDKYKNQIDYTYLKQEIGTLLHGIGDGAKRTAEIVKGLRNFSRLDEGDIKTANLNEGIESTLTIVRSAMPNNVKVVLNLGELPLIECYPGKLNQVFLNAINNSVHAMQKNKIVPNHTLTISTYVLDHSVCVSIEDTGIGMSDEVKQKMFEPFFTTKDVGEGTGLGMSIVFKIIESHNGNIDVQSAINKGTKITFTLPKKLVIS